MIKVLQHILVNLVALAASCAVLGLIVNIESPGNAAIMLSTLGLMYGGLSMVGMALYIEWQVKRNKGRV